MKRPKLSFCLLLSTILLTACGGGSGGGPNATSGTGGGGSNSAGGSTSPVGVTGNAGNLAGISLSENGGLTLSADALNRLGLESRALTSNDLVDLNLTEGNGLTEGASLLTRNGQAVAIQLPGGQTFSLPGLSGGTLPGTNVTLPRLPALLTRP